VPPRQPHRRLLIYLRISKPFSNPTQSDHACIISRSCWPRTGSIPLASEPNRTIRSAYGCRKAVMPNIDSSRLEWTVLGFAAVIVIGLTINSAPSPEAAPLYSQATPPSATVSQANVIDRSQKGDRLAPAAPAAKIVFPRGCESQVSPMTKLTPGQFIARCLT
jgi:hypothetical protein